MGTVSADNNRFSDAVSTTNWGNIGGGGGVAAEGDIVYQGAGCQSRKVDVLRGRDYNPAAGGVDMTATDRNCWLCKVSVTNPAVLFARTTPALHVRLGDSSTRTYDYYVAGNDNYPPKGGWLLLAIDPNVAGYRDVTNGGGPAALTSVDYFGVLGNFSTGSKAENLIIDAIDIGAGLHVIGAASDIEDFVTADEGTTGNRWGYVSTQAGIVFINGRLSVGENTSETAASTQFSDSSKVLVWNNGYFATGFARLRTNLGNAATTFSLSDSVISSRGEKDNTLGLGYTTSEDTRLIVEFVGTAATGTVTMNTVTMKNLAQLILTSPVDIDGCSIEVEDITQGTAEIQNCAITTTSITSVATITDPTFGTTTGLHDTDFTQGGAGHAIEIATSGSYTLTGLTFTGYGAIASDAAAIDITETTGTVTLNIGGGGNTPTYKTAGATVVINNSVTVSVKAISAADSSNIQNVRLNLEADAGGPLVDAGDTVTSITHVTTVATCTMGAVHGLTTGDTVIVRGANQGAYNGTFTVTVSSTTVFTYTMGSDPGADATGTLSVAAQILTGLTSAAGVVEDTGYNYVSDQPVTGVLRKGSTTPFYKTGPVSGTITSNGFSSIVSLVVDE